MRQIISIFSLQLLISFCFGQTSKEKQFVQTVQQIATAFSKQDSTTLEKYIDKNVGLYQLDRIGVFEHYNHFATVSFSDTTYPKVLFRQSKGVQLLSLKYEKLPTWDCTKETWSKKGLFVDTLITDHILSSICKSRNKYGIDKIPNKTIKLLFNLENKSRRVVLYDRNKIELIFYLSYLNGKWYLTVIDNLSSDCSV